MAAIGNVQKIMFLTQSIHFLCKLLPEIKHLSPTQSETKLYSWVRIRTAPKFSTEKTSTAFRSDLEQGQFSVHRKYSSSEGVKLGRSQLGRNVGWGCLKIGCWGEYLGLRGARWQRNGEIYIMKCLMICNPHRILFGWYKRDEWERRGM